MQSWWKNNFFSWKNTDAVVLKEEFWENHKNNNNSRFCFLLAHNRASGKHTVPLHPGYTSFPSLSRALAGVALNRPPLMTGLRLGVWFLLFCLLFRPAFCLFLLPTFLLLFPLFPLFCLFCRLLNRLFRWAEIKVAKANTIRQHNSTWNARLFNWEKTYAGAHWCSLIVHDWVFKEKIVVARLGIIQLLEFQKKEKTQK